MNEAKFTPAPWVIIKQDDYEAIDNDELNLNVCTFTSRSDDVSRDQNLIVAAPEMYDLLERLTSHDNCKKDIIHLLGEADSLLAKARGEA